jgi:hypothetical protein
MDTMSIRELSGANLQERAEAGKPLAVTNYRALIGVFLPVSADMVRRITAQIWSRLSPGIEEGEQAMAAAVAASGLSVPLAAAIEGDTVVQTPESKEILNQLREAFNPAWSAEESLERPDRPSLVRIGDLSAARIEKAGEGGEILAVTHDRSLIGFVIPVTPDLIQFLVEQNIGRVLDNIGHGEKQFKGPGLT